MKLLATFPFHPEGDSELSCSSPLLWRQEGLGMSQELAGDSTGERLSWISSQLFPLQTPCEQDRLG